MEQVTNAFLLEFRDSSCLVNYAKINKKNLCMHHFRTKKEEAENCVMPPAVLALLLIGCSFLRSVGVLCGYLSWD